MVGVIQPRIFFAVVPGRLKLYICHWCILLFLLFLVFCSWCRYLTIVLWSSQLHVRFCNDTPPAHRTLPTTFINRHVIDINRELQSTTIYFRSQILPNFWSPRGISLSNRTSNLAIRTLSNINLAVFFQKRLRIKRVSCSFLLFCRVGLFVHLLAVCLHGLACPSISDARDNHIGWPNSARLLWHWPHVKARSGLPAPPRHFRHAYFQRTLKSIFFF